MDINVSPRYDYNYTFGVTELTNREKIITRAGKKYPVYGGWNFTQHFCHDIVLSWKPFETRHAPIAGHRPVVDIHLISLNCFLKKCACLSYSRVVPYIRGHEELGFPAKLSP